MKRFLEKWNKFEKTLLHEARVDDVKEDYPELEDEIEFLHKNDPAGNDKYLEWMAKQVDKGHDEDQVIELVSTFHDNKQSLSDRGYNVDIYQHDIESLRKMLQKALEDKSGTQSKRTRISEKDVEKIYTSDKFLAVVPLTEKASCKYGANTKWCTAATEHENAFDRYFYKMGVTLVYVINRQEDCSDNLNKIALAYDDHTDDKGPQTFWDQRDNRIDLEKAKQCWGEEADEIIKASNKAAGRITDEKKKNALQKVKEGTADYFIKLFVAKQDDTPNEILKKFAERGEVINAIIKNDNTPSEILATILKDKPNVVFSITGTKIAEHNNASPKVLRQIFNIIEKSSTEIGAGIGEWETTARQRKQMRIKIAKNENAPADLLRKLADDKSYDVRMQVAKHDNTPTEVLKKLADDYDLDVSRKAKRNLKNRTSDLPG